MQIKTLLGRALSLTALAAGGWTTYRWAERRRRRIDFRGRVALVTGGSRGLGLAIARELARRGARLALVARTESDLDAAGAIVRETGAEVITITADVSNRADADNAVDLTLRAFGSLDILINNAGVIRVGPLENAHLEDFGQAMDTHFWGPLHMMSAALPAMIRAKGGRIVNIASIGGKVAVPHLAPYSASKFALVGLSDAVRNELGHHEIFVTTVCPGLMRTGSHINAETKGDHEREYAWFAIADSMPGVSVAATRAADKIVDACRDGDPHLTIGLAARAAIVANALAPGVVGDVLAAVNRLLPDPTADGDDARTGWNSQSRLAPSILTRRADRAVAPLNELRGHSPDELHGGTR